MKHRLPDVDAHAGDSNRVLLAHDTPQCVRIGVSLDYAITGWADHPISGERARASRAGCLRKVMGPVGTTCVRADDDRTINAALRIEAH
jgi:hypothetical protein